MPHHQPYQVEGFHGCDKETGIKVLNGEMDLIPSNNSWDWLGNGIYFWEYNPQRALEYAMESSQGKQFNKKQIHTPFVLGAIIELGNCLNLVEPSSIEILKEAYKKLAEIFKKSNSPMPQNKENNRALDCAVIKYIHQTRKEMNLLPYDTVRSPFSEGGEAYSGTFFTTRHHIQINVINPNKIKGIFLPRPIKQYNPNL